MENKVIIKKFFNDVNISDYIDDKELSTSKVLEASTHFRQVSKNIKKIKEKFNGDCEVPIKMINIGVLVIQFATSIEEFYAYMFHPKKGLVHNMDFGNIDCLVFFSLTAKAELDMQDIYDNHHIFSIVFRKEKYIIDYLEKLRLDHIASYSNSIVYSPYKEEAEKEFGKYKLVNKNGFVFFTNYDKTDEETDCYIKYLMGESEYPK